MNIDFAHICDTAFLSTSGGLNIIQTFDRVSAHATPVVHPRFSVAVGITAAAGEYPMRFELINELAEDSEEKVIAQLGGTLRVQGEKRGTAQFIANFINVRFPNFGRYSLYIYVADLTRVLNLAVVHADHAPHEEPPAAA